MSGDAVRLLGKVSRPNSSIKEWCQSSFPSYGVARMRLRYEPSSTVRTPASHNARHRAGVSPRSRRVASTRSHNMNA